MNKQVMTVVAICFSCAVARGDGALSAEVYARAMSVLSATGETPCQFYHGVVGGGFLQDGMSDQFTSFCSFVSNRCEDIVSDWPTYETNDMVRFTLQSAIGFCGFKCQTNLAVKVLSLYEGSTNTVSYGTVEMAGFPYGVPLDAENYLALHYDTPGVSNIITRIQNIAVAMSDTNTVDVCVQCLSGEKKREYLEMKACGAL